MKNFILFFLLFNFLASFSQVGINTTNPSPAAVLDVNSSSNGVNYGGFMLPRVTLAQRDLIPVTEDDYGLLVYVVEGTSRELQVWDGENWQKLFPTTFNVDVTMAAWEVNGVTNFGPSPFNPTSSNSNVTVGGLTRGAGLTTTGGGANNAWGANGWFSAAPTETQTTAIDNNNFVTFTITPNFGVTLSLISIEPYNIRRSGTGPTTGIWQYSIDGVNFIDIGSEITWGGTATTGNSQTSIDLSTISDLQNLTSDTTVTFRIVNWGASEAVGTWYINDIAGNDLIVKGTIIQ